MQTLFTSDRMNLKGEIREYTCPTSEIGISNKYNQISLCFVFMVNGKMSEYNYAFTIKEIDLQGLTLENWYEWYPVAELFFSMGYNFGENPLAQNPMIMKKWINICNGTKGE